MTHRPLRLKPGQRRPDLPHYTTRCPLPDCGKTVGSCARRWGNRRSAYAAHAEGQHPELDVRTMSLLADAMIRSEVPP